MVLGTLVGVNLFDCVKIGYTTPPRSSKAWSKRHRNESRKKEKNLRKEIVMKKYKTSPKKIIK